MEYLHKYDEFLNENKVPSFKDIKTQYIDTGYITSKRYNELIKDIGKKYAPFVVSRSFKETSAYRDSSPATEYDLSKYITLAKLHSNRNFLFKGKTKDIYTISYDHIFTNKDFNFEFNEPYANILSVANDYDIKGKKTQEKLYKTRSKAVEEESNILYEGSDGIAVETNGNNSMAYWTFYHEISSGKFPPIDNCLTGKGKNPSHYNYGKDDSFLVIILPKEDYFNLRRMMFLTDDYCAISDNQNTILPYVFHYIMKKYPKMHKAILNKSNYNFTRLYDKVKNKGSIAEVKKIWIDEWNYDTKIKESDDEIQKWEKIKHKVKMDFFKVSDEYNHDLYIDFIAYIKKYLKLFKII